MYLYNSCKKITPPECCYLSLRFSSWTPLSLDPSRTRLPPLPPSVTCSSLRSSVSFVRVSSRQVRQSGDFEWEVWGEVRTVSCLLSRFLYSPTRDISVAHSFYFFSLIGVRFYQNEVTIIHNVSFKIFGPPCTSNIFTLRRKILLDLAINRLEFLLL